MKHVIKSLSALLLLGAVDTMADDGQSNDAFNKEFMEEVIVSGGKEGARTMSGSAYVLDKADLEQFDFSDLNKVLSTIPGVYIRQEDGFGLRPNIGLRGVTSERSQKITLMEDGILITPAPYSAPAAYYMPNVSRMSTVEVVKGPATIKYGPNNVGGSVNLVTPAIPDEQTGFVDLGAGSDGYEKYQAFFGDRIGDFGYWIDGLRFGSDGFKELDTGGDTGFERNDINVKLQWVPDDFLGVPQRFILKAGYADENSDETYLGLTQQDFDNNPLRRYAASQRDNFDSEHRLVNLDHGLYLTESLTIGTQIYWNHFKRSWNKLDGFVEGPSLNDILEQPDLFPRQIDIIRGDINSNPVATDTLGVTDNDREYESAGIQMAADYTVDYGEFAHNVEVGLRYHYDSIDRDHLSRSYLMSDSDMVSDGIERGNKTLNDAHTDAVATYLRDTVDWRDWKFNAGIRYEYIDSHFNDELNNRQSRNSQSLLAPGAGVFWQYTDQLGFLLGINKGFSPTGASASSNVDAEEAINFEYGLRYDTEVLQAQVIGFFSDYDNLIGRCRASDSGCEVGEEFNGGEVQIAGLEVYGNYLVNAGGAVEFPINVSYTHTESSFQTSFDSSFSQWGNVKQGDALPYLPENIGRIQFGAEAARWEAFAAVSYQGEMRDKAGRGSFDDVIHTDEYTTLDLSVLWRPSDAWLVQFTVDNVTEEEAIVSWRPFGARPNSPRLYRGRVRYTF